MYRAGLMCQYFVHLIMCQFYSSHNISVISWQSVLLVRKPEEYLEKTTIFLQVTFDSDMYNSTSTVVYFNGKDGNLYLRLQAMSYKIHAAKFEQTIIHQHVLLRRESQLY